MLQFSLFFHYLMFDSFGFVLSAFVIFEAVKRGDYILHTRPGPSRAFENHNRKTCSVELN